MIDSLRKSERERCAGEIDLSMRWRQGNDQFNAIRWPEAEGGGMRQGAHE